MSNTSLTSKVTQSRGWTLALGIAAAALAAILLIAYLVQYRSSVNDSTAPTPVLVAKSLIPKGTSGTVIAEKQLFQAATLAKDDLKVGAISDPAYLNGRVAVGDIFPGQQITTADLSAGLTDALPTQLTGQQRAVAISVGGTQGLEGYVASGDRVDIYYQVPGAGGTASRSAHAERPRDARGVSRHPPTPGSASTIDCPCVDEWDALVPPPPGGRREESAQAGRHDAAAPGPHHTPAQARDQRRQRREVDTSWSARSAHSSPSKDSTRSTSSGRCPTTRASSCSG